MMERTSNCSRTRALLVALIVFVIFPGRSGCMEHNYKSLPEAKPECCVREDAEMKRSKDIDYDSFVGLMGRRSVAQPKRMACPCVEEYLQTKRGQLINYGRHRFQRVP